MLYGRIPPLGIVVGASEQFVRLLVILFVHLDLLQLAPVIGYNLFCYIQAAVPDLGGLLIHFQAKLVLGKGGSIHQGGIVRGKNLGGGVQGLGNLGILDNVAGRSLRKHFPECEHQAVVTLQFRGHGFLDLVIRGALALELFVLTGYLVEGESEVEGVLRCLGIQHDGKLIALVNELGQALVLLLDAFFHAPVEL